MERQRVDLYDPETYYQCREKFEHSLVSRMTHAQRVWLHPLMCRVVHLRNRLSGLDVRVLYDHRTKTDAPKIFAITHIGKYDIEACTPVLKDHYYLLSGDYEHIHGSVEEKLLGVNGVVFVKKDDQQDRRLSKEKMIGVLRRGGNLMYFPEGAWNLSENLPLLQCPYGIIDVAIRGGAEIIPVGIEQYDKKFIIAIGENFSVTPYTQDDLVTAISDLRDTMAALKWDIWSYASEEKTIETPDREQFARQVEKKLEEWTASAAFFERAIFKPRTITSERDVYSFFKELPVNRHTAFLTRWKKNYMEQYAD